MARRPSVLCPIDFSNPSRAALRYATAIAERFRTSLTLLTVNDPLLAEAAECGRGPTGCRRTASASFAGSSNRPSSTATLFPVDVEIVVTTGHPAQEILRIGRERHCDLIVMSTHGLTGVRKLFFGATTERVLRETDIPVLVTPAVEPGPLFLDDVRQLVGRILAPVDLTAASQNQVQIAGALASAVDVPLLLAHVVEPVRFPGPPTLRRPTVDGERRARSEQALRGVDGRGPSGREERSLDRLRRPGRRNCQDREGAARRLDRDRPARLAAGRAAHGLGDLSRAVPVADAGAGAAAGPAGVGQARGGARDGIVGRQRGRTAV